jgi:hypothetical protein
MRKTIMAAITAAATTAAVGGAGIAAASTHSGGTTGTEHFQLMSTLPTGTTASLIAYGAFTAAAVDHLHGNVDHFVFSNGTIRVRHSNPTGPQSFNPKTCLLTANLHGTYRILGGTGKYAGISGQGTYRFTILSLGARSGGKCSQSKLVARHQVVNASGPVSLP